MLRGVCRPLSSTEEACALPASLEVRERLRGVIAAKLSQPLVKIPQKLEYFSKVSFSSATTVAGSFRRLFLASQNNAAPPGGGQHLPLGVSAGLPAFRLHVARQEPRSNVSVPTFFPNIRSVPPRLLLDVASLCPLSWSRKEVFGNGEL